MRGGVGMKMGGSWWEQGTGNREQGIQTPMFVVMIRYVRPLDEIDGLMREHVRFLEECYRAGVFLASGRQVPRTGKMPRGNRKISG